MASASDTSPPFTRIAADVVAAAPGSAAAQLGSNSSSRRVPVGALDAGHRRLVGQGLHVFEDRVGDCCAAAQDVDGVHAVVLDEVSHASMQAVRRASAALARPGSLRGRTPTRHRPACSQKPQTPSARCTEAAFGFSKVLGKAKRGVVTVTTAELTRVRDAVVRSCRLASLDVFAAWAGEPATTASTDAMSIAAKIAARERLPRRLVRIFKVPFLLVLYDGGFSRCMQYLTL